MILFATVAQKCNLRGRAGIGNVCFELADFRAEATILSERRIAIEVPQHSMRSSSVRGLLTFCAMLCVGLAGGCKARPHSVTLTWQAPRADAGSAIVGYNVYRSTTSGGPFVKLASRVREPRYEDRLINNGRTYYYVVTAVDQAGRESRFSGEARAVIP
jgi:Fibronectin type III domain